MRVKAITVRCNLACNALQQQLMSAECQKPMLPQPSDRSAKCHNRTSAYANGLRCSPTAACQSICTQTGKLRLMQAVHDATGTMLMIYEPTREDGENYTNKKPGPYVRPGFT